MLHLGVDIGGTKTDGVAIDDDGAVAHRVRIATGTGPDAVLAAAARVVDELGEHTGQFVSLGVGIPGQIESGRVRNAVNLGIEELDLAGLLSARYGVDVAVENDVKAAALGAFHLYPGWKSMAFLNLGTGVAAGIVQDGVLLRGSRGAAGEVGHMVVDPCGPACTCGQRGCVEALCGGGAIARRWAGGEPVAARAVWDAGDSGDVRARRIRQDAVAGVAAAVRLLVLTVDVDVVVLGGGLTGLGERLLEPVREALRTAGRDSRFIASLELEQRVLLVDSSVPAAAFGAALVGRTEVRSNG